MLSLIFWLVVIALLSLGVYEIVRGYALTREWRRQWAELEKELDDEG